MNREERIKHIKNFAHEPSIRIGDNIIIGGLNEDADKNIERINKMEDDHLKDDEIKKVSNDPENYYVIARLT